MVLCVEEYPIHLSGSRKAWTEACKKTGQNSLVSKNLPHPIHSIAKSPRWDTVMQRRKHSVSILVDLLQFARGVRYASVARRICQHDNAKRLALKYIITQTMPRSVTKTNSAKNFSTELSNCSHKIDRVKNTLEKHQHTSDLVKQHE